MEKLITEVPDCCVNREWTVIYFLLHGKVPIPHQMYFLFSRCNWSGNWSRTVAILISHYPPSQEKGFWHLFSCFPSPLSLWLSVSLKEAQAGRIEDIYISLAVLRELLSLPYHAPFMWFLTGSLSRSRLSLLKICLFCPQKNSKESVFSNFSSTVFKSYWIKPGFLI